MASVFPPGEQARAASLQIALIGAALCLILLFRPRGILGEASTLSRRLARGPLPADEEPADARRT
jgi:branched-chain amino acid transport system permease protein